MKGSLIVVSAPSGAGKTTFMDLLTLEGAGGTRTGHVELNGQPLTLTNSTFVDPDKKEAGAHVAVAGPEPRISWPDAISEASWPHQPVVWLEPRTSGLPRSL